MTGLQRFAATLTERFAGLPPPAVTELADRLTAALRVSVTGRPGVGRRTVAVVLNRAAGIRVTDADAEVRIRVLAEVVKPEDAAALRARPDLLILNKADLAGLRAGGPVAAAARDCAEITARTGIPAAPMVALTALAGLDESILDDETVAALRALTDEPIALTSPDAFLDDDAALTRPVRAQLLAHLDLFGIAHAVVALRDDPAAGAAELRTRLCEAGRLAGVLDAVTAAGARAAYRRIAAAERTLAELAVAEPDTADALAGLRSDPQILAARAEVAAALFGDAPARSAANWRTCADGPLDELHRAAATDLCRAALAGVAR